MMPRVRRSAESVTGPRRPRRITAHLRAAAVALVALWSSAALPPAALADASEIAFLREPRPAEILLANGRDIARKINADGLFPDTLDGRKGPLAVETLRRAYVVVAAGVISTDADRDALLDKGLRAFERGFDFAGPSGSFPNERGGQKKKQYSLHPKATFIEAAARSLLLLRQADLTPEQRRRVEALVPRLERSARWLASSRDLEKFFKREKKQTNQLLFAAVALQEAGIVIGDKALTERAETLVRVILARQHDDGVLPEKGGFDSNYQTVSLELLGRYVNTLSPSPWRDTVTAALRKGLDRFVQTVDASGAIDTSRNTRTVACGDKVAGSAPKGRDIDIVPLRLYYLGHFLDDEARLSPIAERVQATGQSFKHDDKCPGAQ